jgi:hypothetical protein
MTGDFHGCLPGTSEECGHSFGYLSVSVKDMLPFLLCYCEVFRIYGVMAMLAGSVPVGSWPSVTRSCTTSVRQFEKRFRPADGPVFSEELAGAMNERPWRAKKSHENIVHGR